MRNLIVILITLFSLSVKAQFGQVGATWTYNDYYDVTHQNFPRDIVSVTDTVINGQVCHIIAGECACGSPFPNYVYENNRKVYWFNTSLNAFTLLYDFNLNAGESWTVIAKNTTSDSLTLEVDSTGSDTINGIICKIQYIHTDTVYGNAYVFEGPVIEWIGSTFCLYPQSASCDPPSFRLRCYRDDFLGFYDAHFAPSCDEIFVDSGIGINEIESRVSAMIVPNPFQIEAVLQIKNFNMGNAVMEISDATGRIVRVVHLEKMETEIKKETLEEGIYYYKIIIGDVALPGRFIII